MAQELLTTFEQDLQQVCLCPGEGGRFEIFADQTRIWSRHDDGGFPEITLLKQKVRDIIAPDKSLGHADRKDKEAGFSGT